LAEFPNKLENFVNKSLESRTVKAQNHLIIGIITRKREMIKVSPTLQKVMIMVLDESQRFEIEAVSDLIKAV
jgi:isoleucyl-tRNA synthetase